MGKKVGVLAALLAVALAVVSIESHRTHTAAIMHKSSANDAWAHYQSTRLKSHNLELGADLAKALGGTNAAAVKMVADYASQSAQYDKQSREIETEARKEGEAADADEHRALRYDLGEGLLEIALVLSSLYFIARRMMFPAIGVIAGIAGVALAISGRLL